MSPAIRLSAVVLFFIVTVEFGGWSLLSMLNAGGELTPFEEQFFRAGHGHAGVLLVLGLAFLLLMDRVRPGPRTQWALAIIYLLGVLAQSGGFFLHVLAGAETGSS